eukprot:403368947
MSSCIKYKYPVEVKHSQASQIRVMTTLDNYLYAAGTTHDKVLTQSSIYDVAFFMKVQYDDASIIFIKAIPNVRLQSLSIYVRNSYLVTLVYNPVLDQSGFVILDINYGTLYNLIYSDMLSSANALSMRNGCFIVDNDGTLLLVHTDYSSSSQYISVLQFKLSTAGDPLSEEFMPQLSSGNFVLELYDGMYDVDKS